MKVLVACEESQRVCIALRNHGHEAYSCDIIDPSGNHPEWHIKQDVLPLLNGNCTFTTIDGTPHTITDKWDAIVAHPPCTYLTVSGNRWYNVEKYGEKALQRIKDREAAVSFFLAFVNADCDRIIIENPIGYMNTHYRKPDQIIQPWMFGDNYNKSTCLWLKGVKPLTPTVTTQPALEYFEWTDKSGKQKRQPLWYYEAFAKARSASERSKLRSKTFPGIAEGIAVAVGES